MRIDEYAANNYLADSLSLASIEEISDVAVVTMTAYDEYNLQRFKELQAIKKQQNNK